MDFSSYMHQAVSEPIVWLPHQTGPHTHSCHVTWQVSVDISTSPTVFEAVEAGAVAHFKANPSDFSGEKMIIANLVGDPLKYMLCVWWEYAYPGQLCLLPSPSSLSG